MKRRNFLRGCLAVTALAILPVPDLYAYPVLYGDGVHDDTDGLTALLNKRPYICEGKLIEGQTKAVLNGGTYLVNSTIEVTATETGVSIYNATFDGRNCKGVMLSFDGEGDVGDIVIGAGTHIIGSGASTAVKLDYADAVHLKSTELID